MIWKKVGGPKKSGEYLLALRNDMNNIKFFKHVEVRNNKDEPFAWVVPGTDEGIFMGNHISVIGFVELTFPR